MRADEPEAEGQAMADQVQAYAEVQERLAALVLGLDDEALARPVRACPGWSVRDTFAHLVGACVDGLSGSIPELDGVDFLGDWPATLDHLGRMSDRQVRQNAGVDLSELVDRWRAAVDRGAAALRGEQPFPPPLPPFGAAILVNDVVVHEGDLRQALGLPPAAATRAERFALRNYAVTAELAVGRAGVPAVALRYDGRELVLGDGPPAAALSAEPHDLVRVLASRRSAEQIGAMRWEGDPSPYLELLPSYGPVDPAHADRL